MTKTKCSKDAVTRDLKMAQNVVIAYTGIEVFKLPTMAASDQHKAFEKLFDRHIDLATKQSDKFTASQLVTVSKGKAWSGDKLKKRFQHLKRVLINDFLPLWNKLVPGGKLPSGKTKAQICDEILEILWNQKQSAVMTYFLKLFRNLIYYSIMLQKTKGKRQGLGEEDDPDDDDSDNESDKPCCTASWTSENKWRPNEWLVFLKMGPPAEDSDKYPPFCQRESGGKATLTDGGQAVDADAYSRKRQRAQGREDAIADETTSLSADLKALVQATQHENVLTRAKLLIEVRKYRIDELKMLLDLHAGDDAASAQWRHELTTLLTTPSPPIPQFDGQ